MMTGRNYGCRCLVLLVATALCVTVVRSTANPELAILDDVRIEQRLDSQIPLNTTFRDEEGRSVKLADYFGDKPVLLSFVYYECPMLCTLVLNSQLKAMRALTLELGKDYEAVTISIDPEDTPALAKKKQHNYVRQFGRLEGGDSWHFLTGETENIRRVADAVGFKYVYVEKTGEYAHSSAIMVVTPEGRLSKYYYGVDYSARDLKFGLLDAGSSKIGSPVDQILLWCYHYDPITGVYGVAIMRLLRVGGALTVGAIVVFMGVMLRRDRVEQGKDKVAEK